MHCDRSGAEFARKALEYGGILDRIDFILTAADVAHGKPAPDIYLLAAAKMEAIPERMLVLEDSSIGTQAGVKAGAQVISVPSTHTRSSNFHGALHVVPSLHAPEIYRLLSLADSMDGYVRPQPRSQKALK